ncbi:hypothetical protein Droror1_Dr00026343 [Drosera rotundifolia]
MSEKEEAKKDCGHHGRRKHKWLRRFFVGFLVVGFIVLLVFLITWAVLQPKKPQFSLQDATIFSFNLTAPNVLSSILQVTINSHNPNDHIGVYYDSLDVYVVYRDQQITYPTSIPTSFQDTGNTDIWSPFVYGDSVPIAPMTGASLTSDESSGTVHLHVEMDGKVRWKVGAFTSGLYRIHVDCPAWINTGSPTVGVVVPNHGIKYQIGFGCSVSV